MAPTAGAARGQRFADEVVDLVGHFAVVGCDALAQSSNDNAYAESIFRTCKYRPEYPSAGFATLDEARAWVMRFEQWYNTEHRHSGLNFVTPAQRHTAQAQDIMKQRIEVYAAARARNPWRWSGASRNWSLPTSVWLNPERAASPKAQAA